MSAKQPTTLAEYRRIICAEWLPITGKKRLSSFEYKATKEWYDEGKPLAWIIRAIAAVKGRCSTLYSIGVIRSDLAAIERNQAILNVGARQPSMPQPRENWREEFADGLDLFARDAEARSAEHAAKLRELKDALPSLNEEEASARFQEIWGSPRKR